VLVESATNGQVISRIPRIRAKTLRRRYLVLFKLLGATVIAGVTAWSALALWYRLPAPEAIKFGAASLFALFGCITIVALFSRLCFRALSVFIMAFAVVAFWWITIEPAEHADWAPDVARQVTGKIEGERLILTNVREFEWRTDKDFIERWTTRTYDLNGLRTLDFFMSYWAGPEMAHVILSFGFTDGTFLAWSVEVRREKNGEFSPMADLFKNNPLVIIAAQEQDVVGVRSNVRGEDVQLYRLRATPEDARLLLLEYVRDANALAASPKFYNSILTNCTTTVVKMVRAVGDKVPLDWRLIVNGYLPDYAYDQGALDHRLDLAHLKALAHVEMRALEAGLTPEYSQLIRVGVPSPHN